MKRGRKQARRPEWTRAQLRAAQWSPEQLRAARERWDLNRTGPQAATKPQAEG